MNGKNCPNCGAVYTLEDVKCPYCGTLYFDMGAIDFTSNEPIFLRFKINQFGQEAYITQCAIPRLEDISIENEDRFITDGQGNIIQRITTSMNVSTNVVFEALPFKKDNEQTMFTITLDE